MGFAINGNISGTVMNILITLTLCLYPTNVGATQSHSWPASEPTVKSVGSPYTYSAEEQHQQLIFESEKLQGSLSSSCMESEYVIGESGVLSKISKRDDIKSQSSWEEDSERYEEWTEDTTWKCPPCTCHAGYDRHASYASCTYLNLEKFPETLPKNVTKVDLSFNRLTSFHSSDILLYPCLIFLNLTYNRITTLSRGLQKESTSRIQNLTLTNNLIYEIANDTFSYLSHLKTLHLSFNNIQFLNSTTFRGLSELETLDLSNNLIRRIHDDSFQNLYNLRTLFLNNNTKMGYYKNFSPKLLRNLKCLETLCIQGSSHGTTYPSEALSKLVNLTSLSIDGLRDGQEFGSQMKLLTKLTHLNFGPNAHCKFKNISHTFFQYFRYLKHLSFNDCYFQYIDPRAFKFLSNLEEYSLHNIITYDVKKALQSLKGFQNSSLRRLALVRIFHDTTSVCRILSEKDGKYLKNLSLHYLDLSNNGLARLDNKFIENIPTTLRQLVLSRNRFVLAGNLWDRLGRLTNLKVLDVRFQNQAGKKYLSQLTSYYMKLFYYQRVNHLSKGNCLAMDDTLYSTSLDEIMKPNITAIIEEESRSINISSDVVKSYVDVSEGTSDMGNYHFSIPPKLSVVLSSDYYLFGGILLSHKKLGTRIKLSTVDFSHSFLSDWTGWRLPFSVEYANLSYNQCSNIETKFFALNNRLKCLNVRKNYLGPVLAKDHKGAIFARLHQLEHLDLSVNLIYELPYRTFEGLKAIKFLILSDNKIKIFNISLSHMTNLTFLDLSKNSIFLINDEVKDDLDALARNKEFLLDINDNPIPCTCSGLEIMKWMAFTNVTFFKSEKLTCVEETGKKVPMGDLIAKYKHLERQCANMKIIILAMISAGTIMALATVIAILYGYKWKLIYFKNKIVVRLFGYKPTWYHDSTLKYDAYVVSSDNDREFVLDVLMPEMETTRNHRLCIEERDFLPGTFIYNTITCAIQYSAHIIMVLSPDVEIKGNFLYRIQMALMEDYHRKDKDSMCHIIFLENSRSLSVPREMLVLMKEGRYMEFPPSKSRPTPEMKSEFWDRLSRLISHYGSLAQRLSSTMLDPEEIQPPTTPLLSGNES